MDKRPQQSELMEQKAAATPTSATAKVPLTEQYIFTAAFTVAYIDYTVRLHLQIIYGYP